MHQQDANSWWKKDKGDKRQREDNSWRDWTHGQQRPLKEDNQDVATRKDGVEIWRNANNRDWSNKKWGQKSWKPIAAAIALSGVPRASAKVISERVVLESSVLNAYTLVMILIILVSFKWKARRLKSRQPSQTKGCRMQDVRQGSQAQEEEFRFRGACAQLPSNTARGSLK